MGGRIRRMNLGIQVLITSCYYFVIFPLPPPLFFQSNIRGGFVNTRNINYDYGEEGGGGKATYCDYVCRYGGAWVIQDLTNPMR